MGKLPSVRHTLCTPSLLCIYRYIVCVSHRVYVPQGTKPYTRLVFIGRGVAECQQTISSALDDCRVDQKCAPEINNCIPCIFTLYFHPVFSDLRRMV